MAGVRGYKDPNVAISDGKSVFYQKLNSSLSTKADYLLPFYLNEKGGKWLEANSVHGRWLERYGAVLSSTWRC